MYQFKIFAPHSDRLICGITSPALGSFKKTENPDLESSLQRLSSEFGIERPVFAHQAHEDRIIEVTDRPAKVPVCDGFITQTKNLPLMVTIADCQGILMYDPVTHSAAALHSGWRSSARNILGQAVKKLRKIFGTNPADLLVAISPSLGPCCAKFSDPKNELPRFCQPFIQSNNHVDFWKLSRLQLQDIGVPEENIELAGVCTKCQPGYYSHRNGDRGRTGVFVTLK